MISRRQFLFQTLKNSSLIVMGGCMPQFLARSAQAATPGKDTILVIVEMTGGNDGLNTVVPYGDDLYLKARPTLRLGKQEVVRIDDYHGLNPGMRSLVPLLETNELAIVQGIGYPNPDRSHFESMDVWQSADPKRKVGTGWLARSMESLKSGDANVPGIYVGTDKMPLAMSGAGVVPTIHPSLPYDLELGSKRSPATNQTARRRLIEELALLPGHPKNELLQFVQRSEVQTYATSEKLRNIMQDLKPKSAPAGGDGMLIDFSQNLKLIADMIGAGFAARIYYVAIGSFDHHSEQRQQHERLLRQLADGIVGFFSELRRTGHSKRVVLMTFSEFGRRVRENGSKGTDHGAASSLFVAGPAVAGGLVGKHPSLSDLDNGDLKHHTDFRQVYATLLDNWLGCPSKQVLGARFEHLKLLRQA
jgi:uncharacterized protein (DUF1501 family)